MKDLRCALLGSATLTILFLAVTIVSAQSVQQRRPASTAARGKTSSTAQVQTLLEQAERARKTGDLPTAIRLYKQMIVAAPDKEEAHSGLYGAVYFEETSRLRAEAAKQATAADPFELNRQAQLATNARLAAIYRPLAAAQPRVAAYQFELVKAEHARDGKLRSELEKTVSAHPRFAPALALLAHLAAAIGDFAAEREYYRKASLARPDDDKYAYFYLSTFRQRERQEYPRLVKDFLARYPNGEFVDSVLRDAAAEADTVAERVALLERAAKRPKTFYVDELLALYARADVHKAAEFAQRKLDEARSGKDGRGYIDSLNQAANYYAGLARAQALLKAGQLAEAQAALDAAVPPAPSLFPVTFPRTKVKHDLLLAQGKAAEAYQFLLEDRETLPDANQTVLAVTLGARLGKPESQVMEEIIATCLRRGKSLEDFELENLKGDGKTRLSGYRGRFVLVNFWHPT